MRKIILAILAMLLVLSACGKTPAPAVEEKPTDAQAPAQVTETETLQEITAFLEQVVNSDVRPIAVMIDNDDESARPQAGLEDAYLIYEIIVEGGATRFMALFKNTDTAKIGPVRSSRHYFLDYVMENDAVYTHYGWSPKAMEDIPAYGINNINGVEGSDSAAFWRDSTYTRGWHTAFTSVEKIDAMAQKKGYANQTTRKNGLAYADSYSAPQSDMKADKITLRYSSAYTTGYAYNAETKMYEKSINNRPHKMQSGAVLETKNILIQLAGDVSLGDGSDRRNVYTTGSGKGYYISEGVAECITWSKNARGANTEYKKADGTPLVMNPGKTIVNVISPTSGVVME